MAKLSARSVVLTAHSVSLAETLVDRTSFRMIRLVLASADATERAEIGFLAKPTQALAEAVGSLGEKLRATEPGTIYLYLAGTVCVLIAASLIFVWASI